MSPRAAWRLESLGFQQVYDYVAGKADWGAAGLPLEGTAGPYAGEQARPEVPTCSVDEPLTPVRARVRGSGWELCVVVNAQGVVLGLLGRNALRSTDATTVEAAMRAGPSTIRPNTRLSEINQRLHERSLLTALVTRSDGTLVGVLRREDADKALASA